MTNLLRAGAEIKLLSKRALASPIYSGHELLFHPIEGNAHRSGEWSYSLRFRYNLRLPVILHGHDFAIRKAPAEDATNCDSGEEAGPASPIRAHHLSRDSRAPPVHEQPFLGILNSETRTVWCPRDSGRVVDGVHIACLAVRDRNDRKSSGPTTQERDASAIPTE
ncbi:hypothetical protein [Microbispora sp. NPDC046933]|uniref:hypothetical protein n=1 Tax=Microbispora sp. NPDC046933 TaxID=3155618 RepID=UPI0033F88448